LSVTDDFSPIADEGEFKAEGGLLGRLRRRHNLEPVSGGYARVLLDEEGAPVLTGDQMSAGQKYWSRARSWVKVDVRRHTLEYEIRFSDPSGRAGFIATITATCSVKDPEMAVVEGAEGVKDVVVPALRAAIKRVSNTSPDIEGDDPVKTLSAMRVRASQSADEVVGQVPGVPAWLSAEITAVSVDFDAATASHRDELIRRSRDGQLIIADGENKKIETNTSMEIREIVRTSLTPHLANPATRAIEVVASDPSPENINALVNALNGVEAAQQSATIALLQELIEKDYLDKEDPIYKAIVDVAARVIRGESFSEARSSLGTGTPAKEITAGEGELDPESEDPPSNSEEAGGSEAEDDANS
jgi:hypothetical protein